jgi:hypothetical protein
MQSLLATRRTWHSIFIPSSNIHSPYQWGLLKSETLWWKRWFQLFDCELSIYKYIETFKQTLHMEYIYPSVDTTFQRLWFISWFPWYMAVANSQSNNWNHLFHHKVSLLSRPHWYGLCIFDEGIKIECHVRLVVCEGWHFTHKWKNMWEERFGHI